MNGRVDPYPSRHGGREELLERPDPVVHGDGAATGSFSLSSEQLNSYAENGFIILEGYLTEEVENLKRAMDEVDRELRGRDERIAEPDNEDQVRSLFDIHKHHQAFDRFSRLPGMMDIATQLLGGEVYIHQSRINIKPALKGKAFPWHSDFETWHVEDGMPRCRAVTGWICLTGNNPFNGPLFVIPGSHKRYVSCTGNTPEDHFRESLRKQSYGSPSHRAIETLAAGAGMAMVAGPPGTVVFHESNIMHGSPDNISPWPRTNAFFVYNALENRPEAPFGVAHPRPPFLAERNPEPLRRWRE